MPSASSAAGNFDNRHVEIVCAESARVNVSVFYQPLTPPTGLGLLASPRAAGNPGRVARGSVAPRKMACRPAARGETFHSRFKPSTCARGAAWSLPLSNRGAGMDAKTRDLALLAALSFICTGVAWIWGYVILGSVFFALGGVAAIGLAENHWR
jgi:hypothetical protein